MKSQTEAQIALSQLLNHKQSIGINWLKNKFRNSKLLGQLELIPPRFFDSFDLSSYLYVNPDIQLAIENHQIKNALEHFILNGHIEVKQGKRRIGNAFPYLDLRRYREDNIDLHHLDNDALYTHFLENGYKEFLMGQRVIRGNYDFSPTQQELETFRAIFNEEKYLLANPDIVNLTQGKSTMIWEHLITHGFDELRQGKRQLYKTILPFDESTYIEKNADVFDVLKQNLITSPFTHLISLGYKEILANTRERPISNPYDYVAPTQTDDITKAIKNFANKPLISVVMPVYNVDPHWLKLAINSLKSQWYPHWELCIADDKSTKSETIDYLNSLNDDNIKVTFLKENLNISGASNAALALAQGNFIALMDNDDELTPDAFYEMVKCINETGADFIYSDEDKIEMDGRFSDPHFKPDYSPEQFLSTNYLSHLGVIRKSLIDAVGGWEIGLEGSQDYDLYLKVLERTDNVQHIPKVLYHWRKIAGSTAAEYGEKSYAHQAGKQALQNAMQRRGIDAIADDGKFPGTYRVCYKITGEPLVSIVIPFKDKPELLDMCINALLEKSTYGNFEVIGISNNSEESATFAMMDKLAEQDKRVKFYEYNEPFNYSAINNFAVKHHAKGEHIILLNNDIEIITPEWIENLLALSQQPHVGAVCAKLYYPNGNLQHVGVAKVGNNIIHPYCGHNGATNGYFSRLQIINNFSAVTAACLMVKKSLYEQVGGLDENLVVAYNDVDFCLSLLEHEKYNVFMPYVEAYHYESVSRGHDSSPEKTKRLLQEGGILREKHSTFFNGVDPFYNPNLTPYYPDFSLSPLVTTERDDYLPQPYTEVILKSNPANASKHNRVAVFSHFDKDDIIDDYVIYYLSELSKFFDIVFVSTAEGLSDKQLKTIAPHCMHLIVKENEGYDFGAWKTGIDFLGDELANYDELLLCNDSVYGPIHDLQTIHEKMADYDIWSMSKNFEIKEHLQSYYMVYKKKAFTSKRFIDFWKTFQIYPQKTDLIQHHEVDFSYDFLQDDNFKTASYLDKPATYYNLLQFDWDKIIEKDGFPFIKIEVLRNNPYNLAIENWEYRLPNDINYSTKRIDKHLSRVC